MLECMLFYQFYAKNNYIFDKEMFGSVWLLSNTLASKRLAENDVNMTSRRQNDVKIVILTSYTRVILYPSCKTTFPSRGRVHRNSGRVCKKRFSAIFTSADKSFLALPTGISMSPTGARKCRLTRGGVRRLSCMMSGRRLWRYDVILHVLTSCWHHFFRQTFQRQHLR